MRRILVPGLADSPPDHWQSLWQRSDSSFERLIVPDFLEPDRDEWVAALERLVLSRPEPGVLIGHSLGVSTIVQWTRDGTVDRVAGAMLVGPSDVSALAYPDDIAGFIPMPLDPLPFPTLTVLSTTDPYVSVERGYAFGNAWGSRIVEIGPAGHINGEAGYGPWGEGLDLLATFTAGLAK